MRKLVALADQPKAPINNSFGGPTLVNPADPEELALALLERSLRSWIWNNALAALRGNPSWLWLHQLNVGKAKLG